MCCSGNCLLRYPTAAQMPSHGFRQHQHIYPDTWRCECMWAACISYIKLLPLCSLLKLFFIKPHWLLAGFLSPRPLHLQFVSHSIYHHCPALCVSLRSLSVPFASFTLPHIRRPWWQGQRLTGSVGVLISPWSALELDLHQRTVLFDILDVQAHKGRQNIPWQTVEFPRVWHYIWWKLDRKSVEEKTVIASNPHDSDEPDVTSQNCLLDFAQRDHLEKTWNNPKQKKWFSLIRQAPFPETRSGSVERGVVSVDATLHLCL